MNYPAVPRDTLDRSILKNSKFDLTKPSGGHSVLRPDRGTTISIKRDFNPLYSIFILVLMKLSDGEWVKGSELRRKNSFSTFHKHVLNTYVEYGLVEHKSSKTDLNIIMSLGFSCRVKDIYRLKLEEPEVRDMYSRILRLMRSKI